MSALDITELRLVDTIEQAPMLQQVLDWVAIGSGTGHLAGLATMATTLADAFAALPGEVALLDPDPVDAVGADGSLHPRAHGQHLMVRVRPQAERRLLLTGHMDTVFGPDHPFRDARWQDAETLNAPGAADMKGGIAVMLAALLAFERTRPTLGYDVFINSDEETGSLSSARLIRGMAAGKVAAFVYEPALAGGAMARARPGSGNFAAVIRGRAAHAGRNPREGRNAIVAAADLALRLSAAASDTLSVNPARIDGGGPDNLVPDLAILRFNIRPHGAKDAQDATALVDAAIAAVSRDHQVAIALHGGVTRPPKAIASATGRLFACVAGAGRDLGHPLAWHDTGGVCDGNTIAACGVPVIDTMGACGGAIHSPDEFLLVDSLSQRARLSALVLHRLERAGGVP